MEKKELKWEPCYAWFPVFLEEGGIAWLEDIEQAFDEEFYKDQLENWQNCGFYPVGVPLGRYFYRRIVR